MSDNRLYKNVNFDDGAQGFLILLLLSQLLFTGGLYLFFGAVCFGVIVSKLQQPYKPSIFTIIFAYHFIQISANIWLSNYLGKDVNFRSDHSGVAILISFIGLCIMFAPIIYFQNKIPYISLNTLKQHASRLSISNCFKAYIIAFFLANALGGIAFASKGLSQVIFSFINVKWVLYLVFGLQVVLKRKMFRHFMVVSVVEFGLGFISYFSDFKTVILFLAFIAIIFIIHVRLRHIMYSLVVLVILVFIGVKWTAIKDEYRTYLNRGSKTQSLAVTNEEAFNKLMDLSTDSYKGLREDPVANFLDRIQYTYHLAKTLDRVPSLLPHEDGANIRSSLEFVLTPRILNPDKPRLEATVKTKKYTGVAYIGYDQGASFSLGYFGDCYIDFGYFGMYIPLFILGMILGSTYFYFARNSSRNFIFNYSVVGAMFMEFIAFEMDGTFLLGRLFTTLLTFLLLKVFLFPWLMRQLSETVPENSFKTENTVPDL